MPTTDPGRRLLRERQMQIYRRSSASPLPRGNHLGSKVRLFQAPQTDLLDSRDTGSCTGEAACKFLLHPELVLFPTNSLLRLLHRSIHPQTRSSRSLRLPVRTVPTTSPLNEQHLALSRSGRL